MFDSHHFISLRNQKYVHIVTIFTSTADFLHCLQDRNKNTELTVTDSFRTLGIDIIFIIELALYEFPICKLRTSVFEINAVSFGRIEGL